MNIIKISAALAALALTGVASSALACDSPGFLAQVACQTGIITNEQAHRADAVHAALGNPLDRVPGQVMNAYVPGAGTIYDAVRPYPGAPGPMGGGAPMQTSYQQQMTSFCSTQLGRINLYPQIAPVGTSCWVNTPYGQAAGIAQ